MAFPPKRKFSGPGICSETWKVLDLIKSKKNDGILFPQIKSEAFLTPKIANKSLDKLIALKLIKEFNNIKNQRSKHYMGIEFEPSNEVGGGAFRVDGVLDAEWVEYTKDVCLKTILRKEKASVDQILDFLNKSGAFKVQYTMEEIGKIVQLLVLKGDVRELVEDGKIVYKLRNNIETIGVMSSIPCGVCPRINDCSLGGKISPTTCVYMEEWLKF